MKKFGVIIVSLLLLSVGLLAQEYSINTDESNVKWLGEKVTGEHYGTINLKTGTLAVEDNKLSGKFAIDMSSITVTDIPADNENNGKLTGHLKSDDFFGVSEHPTAVFEITKSSPMKVKDGQKANYRVYGNLTIKGITHEIDFPAYVTVEGDKVTAQAKVTVDRSKYNVKFRSGSFFDGLGDKLIYDDFHLDLSLVGSK